MKKILSILIILFLSMIVVPTVKAEGNYYDLKLYNLKYYDGLEGVENAAFNFLFDRGLFTSEFDADDNGSYFYDGTLMFADQYDASIDDFVMYIPDTVTAQDNVTYTFTNEDKTYISNHPEYSSLIDYDGINIIVKERKCDDNEVCIIGSEIIETQGSPSVKNKPVINGLTISFDVLLNAVNDMVKYKITIQNKTNEEYKLNVDNFNSSKYIKYTYSFDDNTSKIKANSEKEVFVTIKYEKQVPEDKLEAGYVEENRMVLTTKDDVVNPKTGQINLVIILSIAVVALIVAYKLFDKKTKQISLSILLLAILIPIGIKALTELTITVNTKIKISNGFTMESRYINNTNIDNERDFWQYAGYIKTITFSKGIVKPSDAVYEFDVSEDKNKNIMAYLVINNTGTSTETFYDLYIMSNGKINANPDSSYMFANMRYLEVINGLELLNTSKSIDMSYMFYEIENLEELDLSTFDTSNVTNMEKMLALGGYDNMLTSLNISSFNTSNVTNMESMFSGLYHITELNLFHFDTSKVINMSHMFNACTNLKTLNISSFNTSNVTDMSYMFDSCRKLEELSLANFDTRKVISMRSMFAYCVSLIDLDLTSFDTSNVITMETMFGYSRNLSSIFIGEHWNTDAVINSNNMFVDCRNIVGTCGTTYSAQHIDKEYARADEENMPGYMRPGYPG